jgi:hypothetical protein
VDWGLLVHRAPMVTFSTAVWASSLGVVVMVRIRVRLNLA